MAIANFFNKIALSASQILHNYDQKQFEQLLLSQHVAIFYDENAANTEEGKVTLDLLIRLFARLYPNLSIEGPGKDLLINKLTQLAKKINPVINLSKPEKPTLCVIVGKTDCSFHIPKFYIGSKGWISSFSISNPVGSSNSNNPFGAAGAACFAAANVFRFVFKEQLPYSKLDDDFSISLFDFSTPASTENPEIPLIELTETLIVGVGAIGNGVIWALKNLPTVTGAIVLIDHEDVALSNLQRYILATQDSIDRSKVEMVSSYLKSFRLKPLPESKEWKEYINKRGNWKIETILSCIDNGRDRIQLQGALPKKLFNAWTQRENIGISRHTNFINNPCLCCLYYPTSVKRHRSQEIADSLNLSSQERLIREYLVNQKPVDNFLLGLIVQANNIEESALIPYIGKSLNIFYSEVVCGGVLLTLNGTLNDANVNMEVPSAFESALAGILLTAELIKDKLGFLIASTSTQFNLLRPISKYLNRSEEKKTFCICSDETYKQVYREKWSSSN